ANERAIGQLDLARALDLQEKGIDGIIDPEERQLQRIERAAFDLGPRGIGQEPARDDATGDALAAQCRAELPEIDGHEITGTMEQWILIGSDRLPRAAQQRLVIPREEAVAAAIIAGGVRREIAFEELPRRGAVTALPQCRGARRLPIDGAGAE